MAEIEPDLMNTANHAAEFLRDVLPMAIPRERVSVATNGGEAWVYIDSGIPLSALRVRINQDGSPGYTVLDLMRCPVSPVYPNLATAVGETAIEMTDRYLEITSRIKRLRQIDEERIVPVEPFAHSDDEPPEPSRSLVDAAYNAADYLKDVLPVTIRWSNIRVRCFETEAFVYLDVGMELAALRVRIGADGAADYTVTDNERTPLSPVYADLAQAVAEVAITMTDGYTEFSWRRRLERRARKGDVYVVVKTETEEATEIDMNF